MYETLDCFIYFGGLCPPHPHLCLNFIFKILLNHYNVSFNSVGSASYIYNFMLVIKWHFYYYYYVLGKRSPMTSFLWTIMKELRDLDFCLKKEGGRKENLQTDEILCHCCLYKFPRVEGNLRFPSPRSTWQTCQKFYVSYCLYECTGFSSIKWKIWPGLVRA